MKTKFYIISLLLCVALTSAAQNIQLPTQFRSSNQQLIQDAISDALYIINSSYLLQDSTGNQFGRQGKEYFNQLLFFNCAINNAYILPSYALTPWNNDPEFTQYKTQYQPLLQQLQIRNINDTAFFTIDSTTLNNKQPITPSYISLPKPQLQGFDIDTTKGPKDGWLCLITQNDNEQLEIRCINYKINIDSTQLINVKIQSIFPKTLGGVYLNPVISKPGNINFKLCGIIQPAPQGNSFNIDLPFFSSTKPNNNISTIKPNDPKIIPIQKNKQQPRKP